MEVNAKSFCERNWHKENLLLEINIYKKLIICSYSKIYQNYVILRTAENVLIFLLHWEYRVFSISEKEVI